MKKRMAIVILALIVVFGGVFGWNAFVAYKTKQYFATRKPPPVSITATVASRRTWTPTLEAIGSLAAVQGVMLANEVDGTVKAIHFKSGQEVKAGDLLVELDADIDQAQLKGLKASLELGRIELKRQQALRSRNATSVSSLDSASSEMQQAEASVEAQQALIAKKSIRAPFDGKLGIRNVNVGQYLAVGSEIVTLESLDPIYVNYTLPQQDLKEVQPGQSVRVSVDTYPGAEFAGKVTAIAPEANTATRSFAIQATMANSRHQLRPGMFAEVHTLLAAQNTVLTLPQTAISYNPYGDAVFVIAPDGKDEAGKPVLKVHSAFVVTGATRGDQVAIEKGIKAGDQVVTSGQIKLRNGSVVTIDNTVEPANSPTPRFTEE